MKLVTIQNNCPVTDSLTVAEAFGKEHRNVLADIENQINKLNEAGERDWGVLNFQHTQYQHPQNKQWYPKIDLTEDAFTIVAMGYVTVEAMKMKVKFINEFRQMREELSQPSDVEKFLLNPDTIIKLAENWKSEMNLRIALESKIALDRPKVVFAESLEVSNDTILIGQLAKILKQNGFDIGEKRLFAYLREEGYLMKHVYGDRKNQPTQRSMDLGLMMVKVGVRSSSSEGTKNTYTTKITGKGIMYFINKFKNQSQSA